MTHNLEYKYLTITGGGIKGVGFVGALTALDKTGILKNIVGYSGSSIGAVLCLLLNLNYSISEIKEIAFCIDFSKFHDPTVSTLVSHYGFDNGEKINKLLLAIIKQKQNPNITFEQLFNISQKLLVITGSNINNGTAEYFSNITTPSMPIIQALRISISIPIFFSPVRIDNTIYCDGALFDPCPIKYFDDISKVLAIVNRTKFDIPTINKFEDYLYYMINGVCEMFMEKSCKPIMNNAIYLDFSEVNSIDFEISNETKEILFNSGYHFASDFYIRKRHIYWILRRIIRTFRDRSLKYKN